jgi:hypothetical protein
MSLQAFLSEAIPLKLRDCFGKKRLAMTKNLTLNEYNAEENNKTLFFEWQSEYFCSIH